MAAGPAPLSPGRGGVGGIGGGFSSPTTTTSTTTANLLSMMPEADTIILPPPTPVNPIPSLPAAIRVDNQEQLLTLLATDPTGSSSAIHHGGIAQSFRQLLLFGDEHLRTLLLRQVICGNNIDDYHSTKSNKPGDNKSSGKKNWLAVNQFNTFPKALQPSIVGTQVLSGEYSENERIPQQHIDVKTYFLRPWDSDSIQKVLSQIAASGGQSSSTVGGLVSSLSRNNKNYNVHHRLVFIPQISASVSKLIQETTQGQPNVQQQQGDNMSLVSLQMDIFPLESDLLSLEYPVVQTPDIPPSEYITTCARALLKIQDVVGKIPRIQSMSTAGEEVLQKLLAMTVEDDDQLRPSTSTTNNTGSGEGGGGGKAINTNSTPLPDNDLAMILVDRKVDMVTPMVTALTYEGLLDEVIGINCG